MQHRSGLLCKHLSMYLQAWSSGFTFQLLTMKHFQKLLISVDLLWKTMDNYGPIQKKTMDYLQRKKYGTITKSMNIIKHK